MQAPQQAPKTITDANFPLDNTGHTYHLGLKKGELATRVITVGDTDRANRLAKLFESIDYSFTSSRHFTTHTGTYKGEQVSVVASLMGGPNMAMFVTEAKHSIANPEDDMAIIRLGSCGTPQRLIPVGSIVAAEKSFSVTIDADKLHYTEEDPYVISRTIEADPRLHQLFVGALKTRSQGRTPIYSATDCTAQHFYSTQYRQDPNFDNRNENLEMRILKSHPTDVASLQMETYDLYSLAIQANRAAEKAAAKGEKVGKIFADAGAIVFANRPNGTFINFSEVPELEKKAGLAALDALIAFPLNMESNKRQKIQ